jgi:peptide/nickel transport system permease protein
VFVVLAVSTIVFVILHAIGDPARLMLSPEGTKQELEDLRHTLGLDAPLHIQYLRFLLGILRADFGKSFTYGRPALGLVLQHMPATAALAGASLLVGVPLAVLLGVTSAIKRYTLYDSAATVLAVLGRAIPNFWLGIMLILVLSVKLRWLPPSGYGSVRQLIMPAVALGTSVAATIARLTRSSMLDVIQQDYIRTARAKGLGEWIVVYRHALRNALIPVVTLVGLQVGTLLGGAIVTETVFAWPGVGRLLVESISDYDFPTVQACVFVIALTFVLVNLLVDILYHYIDPRIRTG